MYPKPAKDVGQVRLAIMQWEDKWKSDDVRARRGCEDSRSVEDVGVAGNLSERCEEQTLMRLDEIGENYGRTSRR